MFQNNIIYFDNAATTKPDEEVVALYNDLEVNHFGNSSSIHAMGIGSNSLENKAKTEIYVSLRLKNYKVLFCSSATEANNLAIKGCAFKYKNRGTHLITTKIEHPSVLESFRQLEKEFGFTVTYLNVDQNGIVDIKELENALDDKTTVVSIMAINNEIGSINPIKQIADIVHKYPKALLHVDATQAIGKHVLPYNDIDLFSFSAHKINGLKGSGALIFKDKISFVSQLSGGKQEYGFRAGTVSVAQDSALALALMKSIDKINENYAKIIAISEYIRKELESEDIEFNSPKDGSPYILNFSLRNKKASVVVEALSNKQIYVSSVSACNSKYEASSYVIESIGKEKKLASNTIRLSFSHESTMEEAKVFVKEFKEIMRSIR